MADTLDIPGIAEAKEIGAGGFGRVYRAHQRSFNRTVAVKVLTRAADPDALRRFQRECQTMGAVSDHPNIVAVYDAGTTGQDEPYMVMQYLAQGSLGDGIRQFGRMDPAMATRIGVKICGALHTAHTAGVLHRDIKPDNILLSDYGEPMLGDFGIARLENETLTGTGVQASVAYAPPEVLSGRPPSVAGDIYSLGATLYHLLAGRVPFPAGQDEAIVSVIARIVSTDPPALSTFGIPGPVAAVVSTAMSRDMDQRYTSALDFGRAMQEAQRASSLSETELPLVAIPDGQAIHSGTFTTAAVTDACNEKEPARSGPITAGRATTDAAFSAMTLAGQWLPPTPPSSQEPDTPGVYGAASPPAPPNHNQGSNRRTALIVGAVAVTLCLLTGLILRITVFGSATCETRTLGLVLNGGSSPRDRAFDAAATNGAQLAVSQFVKDNPSCVITLKPVNPPEAKSSEKEQFGAFANDASVIGVIGPVSSQQDSAVEAFTRKGIPMVSAYIATDDFIEKGSGLTFRARPSAKKAGGDLARYLQQTYKPNKIVMASASASNVSYEVGRLMANSTKVVPVGVYSNWKSLVAKAGEENPDLIYIEADEDQPAADGVNQLRSTGYTKPIVVYTPDPIQAAKNQQQLDGTVWLTLTGYDLSSRAVKKFEGQYQERYGSTIPPAAVVAFDVADQYLAAIKTVGVERDKIRSQLVSTPYKGLIRTYRYESNGELSGAENVFLYQPSHGKPVFKGPIRS